jgi:hypothetical protein
LDGKDKREIRMILRRRSNIIVKASDPFAGYNVVTELDSREGVVLFDADNVDRWNDIRTDMYHLYNTTDTSILPNYVDGRVYFQTPNERVGSLGHTQYNMDNLLYLYLVHRNPVEWISGCGHAQGGWGFQVNGSGFLKGLFGGWRTSTLDAANATYPEVLGFYLNGANSKMILGTQKWGFTTKLTGSEPAMQKYLKTVNGNEMPDNLDLYGYIAVEQSLSDSDIDNLVNSLKSKHNI